MLCPIANPTIAYEGRIYDLFEPREPSGVGPRFGEPCVMARPRISALDRPRLELVVAFI